MSQRVAIVTDSTASLPSWVAEELAIQVVPLKVRIGDRVENEDRIEHAELVVALRQETPVSTSEPDSSAFFWTYQGLADAGVEEVVSIHISGRLSGTCESARAAAARASIPVHVIDSLTSGMSLGFLAIAAAQAARSGTAAADIAATTTSRRPEHAELIYVDTLEHLRRGGRIGATSALVGTALSIKPLLTIAEGEVLQVARVRGAQRALSRLVDIGKATAAGRKLDAAVEHVDAPALAEQLAELLRARLPQLREVLVLPASAVLAAHVGPGAVGIALAPY